MGWKNKVRELYQVWQGVVNAHGEKRIGRDPDQGQSREEREDGNFHLGG